MSVSPRTPVVDIQPQTQVDQVFRVLDKQHRSNRQGGLYLLLQMGDRTGMISGLRWNSSERLYESIRKGDYVHISGGAQLHNGMMQIIIHVLQVVDAAEVDAEDFEAHDSRQIAAQWSQLGELLESVADPDLRAVVDAVLLSPTIAGRLQIAPAGVKTHHAYPGGLVRHLIDLLQLADFVATRYPAVHRELLLVGVLLHDLGKIDELAYEGELSYTDAGQLIGHLVQGVELLTRVADDAAEHLGRPVDANLLLRLKHMIVSHHGQLEHGSPKLPMTLEAIALAHLDDLDAKLNAAAETIRGDRNTDSPWTAYHPVLGKKLYKPSLEG